MEHLQLSRVTRALAAAAVLLLGAPGAASAQDAPCTKTWDGPATGNWSVAASWSPDGVPGAGDVACIGAGTSTTVNAATSVKAVRSERALLVTANLTLNDAAQTSSATAMTIGGADVLGDGGLEVGTMTWNHGGQIFGSGTVEIASVVGTSGGMYISGSRTVILTGASNIGSAAFWIGGGAELINRGSITTTGDAWDGDAVGGVAPLFHNEPGATVTKTGTANLGFYSGDLAIDNDGTIAMAPGATGRIYVDRSAAGAQSNGTFTGVSFTGDDHTLGPDAVLTGGSIGSHVHFPHASPLTVTDIEIAGGQLFAGGQVTLAGTATHLYYGRLNAPLVVHPPGAVATWTAAFAFFADRVETGGTLTLTSTGAGDPVNWEPRMVWDNTGTLNLQATSGHFKLASSADEAARLINRGTITKSSTTNAFTFDPVLVNDGLIEVRSGQLSARRFEQTPDGTLRFDVHGTAQGSGYGYLSSAALRYSGRLEAVLSGGHVPPAGQRYNVLQSTLANRSGLFHSTALSGLALDETQAANIGLVQPAAAAVRVAAGPAPVTDPAPDPAPPAPAPATALAAPAALPALAALPAPSATPARKKVRKAKKARRGKAAGRRKTASRCRSRARSSGRDGRRRPCASSAAAARTRGA